MLRFFLFLFVVASLAWTSSVIALSVSVPKKITGSFLDVYYDNRLKYSNLFVKNFTCLDWTRKMNQWNTAFGVDVVIFQTVHDSRFGAYWPTKLPWMKQWDGLCADVVGAVMRSNLKVFLSCEFVYNETDSVSNELIMQKRLEIMSNLADLYSNEKSFLGWYFSSEAYIQPYFQESFVQYVKTLSNHSARVTPNALKFISPYGTHFAVNDEKFRQQLVELPVDYIAYQDEVGALRAQLPVYESVNHFEVLSQAHKQARNESGGSKVAEIWANIESFTWEGPINNASTPLIPAAFSRILAQFVGVSNLVDRVITFSVQSLYESNDSNIRWGPPDGSAHRLFNDYEQSFLSSQTVYSSLERHFMQGLVSHAAVGSPYRIKGGTISPLYRFGNLTDGLSAVQENPYSHRWLGCLDCTSLQIKLNVEQMCQNLAIRFIRVPSVWFENGNFNAKQIRNVTAVLPSEISWYLNGEYFETNKREPWPQESYDIFTHLYFTDCSSFAQPINSVEVIWNAAPNGMIYFIDEIVVNA